MLRQDSGRDHRMVEKKNLTFLYSLVQGAYWMSFCCINGFASVYLRSLSYTNFEIGIIIAMGSLCGALAGMILSSLIDRRENISSKTFPLPLIVIQGLMSLILIILAKRDLLTAVIYVIYALICTALGSLLIKMYVDLNHQGHAVDYSISRGAGSFSYVIISVTMGRLLSSFSEKTLLYVGILVTVIEMILVIMISTYIKNDHQTIEGENGGSSMIEFIRRNRDYVMIIAGAILMFYAHCFVTNFMINVVSALGGNTGTVGYLTGFMAAVEIPVALLYSKLFSDHRKALKIASISMTFKALAVALAFSIPLLFMAFLLQAPSYALFVTCIVPYTEQSVAYEDSAKAQSLAFSTTTIASIIASILGGWMLDLTSVANCLYLAAAICLCGSLLIVYTLRKQERNG